MKSVMTKIHSTSFFTLVLLFSFLVSACTTIRPVTKFDASQLDCLTDDIMELDWLKCGNLANKTVFTDFTVSQEGEDFLEDFDFSKGAVKKIKYEGDIGQDIKRKLEEVLSYYCGARIVQQKDQADITINADIRKYYSQILETEKKGDDSLAGLNVEKGMDLSFKAATILSIITTINNTEDWKYDHLLSLRSNRLIKRKASGVIFVNARNDITHSMNYIVDYDDEYTLAKGAIAYSFSQGSFLVFITRPKWDIKGKLDIYDIDTIQIKKQLTVDNSDFDTTGLGAKVMKKEKKTYFDLYTSTPGNLKYLIYDYIKEVVYKVNR